MGLGRWGGRRRGRARWRRTDEEEEGEARVVRWRSRGRREGGKEKGKKNKNDTCTRGDGGQDRECWREGGREDEVVAPCLCFPCFSLYVVGKLSLYLP